MGRITRSLSSRNMASLASTSRSQRGMARQINGPCDGNVLCRTQRPKFEAVGPKGQPGLVGVPYRIRESYMRNLSNLSAPPPQSTQLPKLPSPILNTQSRPYIVGALYEAVEHYHDQPSAILAQLRVLHRGVRAKDDRAARDVRVFTDYLRTRPTLQTIRASLEGVVDRLSTRALYMIYYAYQLQWQSNVERHKARRLA